MPTIFPLRPALLAALLTLARCADTAPVEVTPQTPVVAELARVVGRTPPEVAEVLGEPRRPPVAGEPVGYRDGINVLYRHGRAARVQATGLGEYRFGPEVLRLFGVSDPPAPSDDGGGLRWEAGAVPPFGVITLKPQPREGRVDYVNFHSPGFPADSIF